MHLYEYQRSRSFIDLCPRSLSFNILKLLFLKNTRPIEAIFHVEPSLDGRMKVNANGLCHMTKMATMAIYAKQTFKVFFSGTERLMNLKLCMQHRGLEYYQVCSNDAPGLTLTYFTARSNLVPYAFVWEKVKTMFVFSETIVVYYKKFGKCSPLNEYMKRYEYQRSRSFIDFGPNRSDSIFLIFFSSVTADFTCNISSALRRAIQDQWFSGLLILYYRPMLLLWFILIVIVRPLSLCL